MVSLSGFVGVIRLVVIRIAEATPYKLVLKGEQMVNWSKLSEKLCSNPPQKGSI
jgi:hypothetical protein